jgi:hypothetical protein
MKSQKMGAMRDSRAQSKLIDERDTRHDVLADCTYERRKVGQAPQKQGIQLDVLGIPAGFVVCPEVEE